MKHLFHKQPDGTTTKRPPSFEAALKWGEETIFGKDFNTSFKTAVKNSKGVINMMEYVAMSEELEALKELIEKERAQTMTTKEKQSGTDVMGLGNLIKK